MTNNAGLPEDDGSPRIVKFEVETDGHDIFVVADGVKIAKYGGPVERWISLVPGWTVWTSDDHAKIEIKYNNEVRNLN